MKRSLSLSILLLALVVGTSPAAAQEYGLALKGGSMGVGFEGTVVLNDYFDFRGGLQFLPLDLSRTFDDVEYTVSLPSPNGLAVVDLYPLGPAGRVFRLTAGLFYSGRDMNIETVITGSTEIGDRVYTPLEIGKLEGQIKNSDFAPYVGVGLGSGVGELFGFYLDLGVALRNPPEATLSADGTLRKDPIFQENLDRERRKIQEDAEVLRYFPVIAVGFRIRH